MKKLNELTGKVHLRNFRNKCRPLNDKQIKFIRNKYKNSRITMRELAKQFNTNVHSIYKIIHRQTYKDVN